LEDKPWLAAAPDGTVHLTWSSTPDGVVAVQILHTASADRGRTWREPLVVHQALGDRAAHISSVAAGGGGRVLVSAIDQPWIEATIAGTPGDVLAWTSEDGGRTFRGPVRIGEGAILPAPHPAMVAVDPADAAHAVVVGTAGGGDRERVWVAETRDGGTTWSAPHLVAPERGGPQHLPAARIDDAGRIVLAFYDEGWPGGGRLVVTVLERSQVVFEGVPEGPPTDAGFYRREYIGLAGVGTTSWVAWVGGNDETGTHVEVARLEASS
jgi:hypothetical protein